MSCIRPRRRKSKKASNPYASRGLDKFALISAELAEKREKLAAQLGAPVSVVRFALGSHSKWVPIIISPSQRRKILSTNVADLLRSASSRDGRSGTAPMARSAEVKQSTATSGKGNDSSYDKVDEVWPEFARSTASFVATTAGVLWATKVAGFGMKITTALAGGALLLKWQYGEKASSRQADEGGGAANSNLPKAETNSIAHPPTMASLPPMGSHLPAMVHVRTSTKDPKAAHKQRHKLKNKGNIATAPSTPRGSRNPNPFSLGGPSDQASNNHSEARPAGHEAGLHEPRSWPRGQKPLGKSESLVREMSAAKMEKQRKEKAARLGAALTVVGLVIVLGGLMLGNVVAVVGVVCWWYALPHLRKAVGDKPFVRSHHIHSHSNDSSSHKSKKRITGTSSAKYDLQSSEYKKKVIMDGLLDRRSPANNA